MLSGRRRVLLAKQKEPILYQLPEKVTHAYRKIFDTGFNLLQVNSDWTVFASLNITQRECFPLANAVSGSYTSASYPNNQILADVYSNGGFCISKGNYGGLYGTTAMTKNRRNNFSSSAFPWDYTGPITCCVVHRKSAKTFSFYLSYGGETYSKVTQSYTQYPVGSDFNLSSFFKGTLSELIVFSTAKTDAECSELLLGGSI